MSVVKISEKIYLIGGPQISHPYDCCVYLIDGSPESSIIIDSGSGFGFNEIIDNINELKLDAQISTLVNTHCHFDHAGGDSKLKRTLRCTVAAHKLDAEAIETGDQDLTAAKWMDIKFEPCKVDVKINENPLKDNIVVGSYTLLAIHTPGHTPGSISLYGSIEGEDVLFCGDIGGPFMPAWNSNVENAKSSVKKLLKLDPTLLCAGHGYSRGNIKVELEKLFKTLQKKKI